MTNVDFGQIADIGSKTNTYPEGCVSGSCDEQYSTAVTDSFETKATNKNLRGQLFAIESWPLI